MPEIPQFLIEHGYALLFLWVLLDQFGLPIPALPLLLAAGALTGSGELRLELTVAIATVAAIPSDLFWYFVGRQRGGSVLRLVCRISLEPDSCVRNTEETFARHGARSLLVARFIPGLQTAARPLAGVFRMRLSRFLLFSTAGALLWSMLYIGLGYAFSNQLGRVLGLAQTLGGWFLAILGGLVAVYLFVKYQQRQRFLRSLRVARITPEELLEKIESGEELEIVDLRHAVDFEAEPLTLPGARRIAVEEIQKRHEEIPRDREIILYCT